MNCNCQPSTRPDNPVQPDIAQQVVMPRDPETIARLLAEYGPQTPVPELAQLSDITSARQLCRDGRIQLKPHAEALLEEGLSPQDYFERLREHDYLPEARRILAHALPHRRALWWACLCAQDAYQHDLPEPVARAVEAVVRFVHDPSEANRREAERVGRSLPSSRLEGSLAMAAFLSGGSVSLPHLPIVQSRPHLTGRLVGVCVYLASVIRSAAHYKQHLREYLALGVDIARGTNLWDEGRARQVRIDGAATPAAPARTHLETPALAANPHARSSPTHQTQERT